MATVQVKLKNGNIVNVKEGSQAHKTYANSVVTNAGTQQQISAQNTANNQARVGQYNTPQTGTSSTNSNSYQTINNNNNSWGNQQSSMFVNGQQATNNQAVQANPLHAVNQQRQEFLKNGDTQGYNNFQAQQSPLHYEIGSDGNATQNKAYYAKLLETTSRELNKARQSGDQNLINSWESTLQRELDRYRNAPGMEQSITGINHTADLANQYGINQASNEWFNSIYNNAGVQSNGYYGSQMWYDNPVFNDQTTRANTAMATGRDINQFNTNPFNIDAMQQAYQHDQSQLIPFAQWAEMTGWVNPSVQQAQQAQIEASNNYKQSEQVKGGAQPTIVERNLGHTYTPGNSSNATGYTDNQVVNDDLFNRFLQNVLKGGF